MALSLAIHRRYTVNKKVFRKSIPLFFSLVTLPVVQAAAPDDINTNQRA